MDGWVAQLDAAGFQKVGDEAAAVVVDDPDIVSHQPADLTSAVAAGTVRYRCDC